MTKYYMFYLLLKATPIYSGFELLPSFNPRRYNTMLLTAN